MRVTPTSADVMTTLRRRTSEKWGVYSDDVLPMFVAEMDFPLAPAIRTALHEAIDVGDTGYVNPLDPSARDAHLPAVRLRRPSASYLAWLDMSALGWGDDPAVIAEQHARVALSSGPRFGRQGAGYARMNLACAPDTITEAVRRSRA